MTILVSGRRRVMSPVPPPYTIPTSAPWNAPENITIPTYDGSNSLVHPDVVDFGVRWNGYRFWMAMTPYPNSNDDYENPSVVASNDGWEWVVPAGITNPIYPQPSIRWNSDTDLSYDSTSDELVLVYRDENFIPQVARSSDGVTWPTSPTAVTWTSMGSEALSPSLVRESDGTWSMWALALSPRKLWRWSGTAPEGTWAAPTECTGIPDTAWHLDVIAYKGVYYALIADGSEGQDPMPIYAATSVDGLAWSRGTAGLISPSGSGWDATRLYRATLQPHENGTHMRVWYPALGAQTWRVGLTHVPLAEWPTPPAP